MGVQFRKIITGRVCCYASRLEFVCGGWAYTRHIIQLDSFIFTVI